MKKSVKIALILAVLSFSACSDSEKTYFQLSQLPPTFPDYTNITIPCNIAPLNMIVPDSGLVSLTVLVEGKNKYSFNSSSALMKFPEKQWRSMLEAEKGNTLDVYFKIELKTETRAYQGFTWTVSPDSIDRYLSYRLIEPAYEVWNKISIEERDLQSFKTRLLGDNNITGNSCMNCHISNHASTPTTFMHLRGKGGGTIYCRDGKIRIINAKAGDNGHAVYGEITSNGKYGVFTTADIVPILHSKPKDRLEVFDRRSDLIIIDFENETVISSPIIAREDRLETFPCFSADNSKIYFCSAEGKPQPDSTANVRYNLYSINFDPETGAIGDSITQVFGATGKSVNFPKTSPDGKYLLFAVSDYGTFPIWHRETDLWMLNLENGTLNTLDNTNGENSDSYHSWSGNSRWFAFASKRSDGVYGQVFFAHVNDDGSASKAFVLPQKNPDFYKTTFKSFNIPELYRQAEQYDAHIIKKLYVIPAKADKDVIPAKAGIPR